LFGLEFLVDSQYVLVEGLREQEVDLLGQVDLGHLQLGEVVRHHTVLVVRDHHLLQDGQVLASELTEALVDFTPNSRVVSLRSIDD